MQVAAAVLRQLHRIHQQLSDLRERLNRGPKQVKAREANLARLEGELDPGQEPTPKPPACTPTRSSCCCSSGEGEDRRPEGQAQRRPEQPRIPGACATRSPPMKWPTACWPTKSSKAWKRSTSCTKSPPKPSRRLLKAKEELAKAQQQVRDQEGAADGRRPAPRSRVERGREELPADFRDAYQRIVKSKGSDAMAPIEGENCGGCYQNITANMFNSLLMDKIVFCGNCGRLLYLPEDRTPGRK